MESDFSFNQQYTLRWNDYHKKLINSFQSLHESDDFVDVTVACEEKTFSAHKVVLSACSPYFRKLLKANPCPHPIIILQTISHKQFEYLINFMYNGVVHIDPENLYDFLQAANDLKIQGLTDVQYPKNFPQNKSDISENKNPPFTSSLIEPSEEERRENELTNIDNMIDMSQSSESSHLELKSEPVDQLIIDEDSYEEPPIKKPNSFNFEVNAEQIEYDVTELLNQTRNQDPNKPDMNLCVICNRNYSNPSNLRAHLINVHTQRSKNLWFECSVCKKKCKTKHYLINHEMQKHGIRQRNNLMDDEKRNDDNLDLVDQSQSYDISDLINRSRKPDPNSPDKNLCSICNRNYSNPSNLRAHLINVHSQRSKNLWFECSICKLKCKTKHYLIIHELQKHGIRQKNKNKYLF